MPSKTDRIIKTEEAIRTGVITKTGIKGETDAITILRTAKIAITRVDNEEGQMDVMPADSKELLMDAMPAVTVEDVIRIADIQTAAVKERIKINSF